MSSISPASVLYSSDGYELATPQNTIPVSGTRMIITSGISSDGYARPDSVDTSGRQIIVGPGTAGSGTGGVLTIQGNASGTAVPVSFASIGTTASAPPTSAEYMGGLVTTATESGLTNNYMYPLSLTTAGLLRVDGSNVNQPVVGTAADNTANSTSKVATIVSVASTSVPSYTSGNMVPLSSTTTGLLRIDGVAPTGAAGPADAMYVAGAVTTAAPSYTTGQMDPLSLTTTGLLRIDGVYPSGATTTNTPDLTFIGAAVTTANPAYTNGNTNALSLDGYGGLRVTGTGTTSVPSAGIMTIQGNASGVPVPISGTFTTDKSSSAAISSPASSATSTTILAANTNRILATVYNDSTQKLYLAMASSASTSAFSVVVMPNSYFELPVSYTGIITGIWTNANGFARVTEYST